MYNPDIHHRRSIRLPDFDYSKPGYFFVTICTQDRTELFGHVSKGCMYLNDAGKMIETYICNLPNRFSNIEIDPYVIMPNHIHFVLHNHGAYKSLTTNEYIRRVKQDGWVGFPGRLWQRNYYERIIRDDDELQRVRTYISDNPIHWKNGDMNFDPMV